MAMRPGFPGKFPAKRKATADLDSPSDFGAPSKPSVPGDPDVDDDTDQTDPASALSGATAVPPDAVHYHDEEQRCELCDNYGQDGQCSLLQMQVQPEGGCNAFTGQNSGGDQTTGDDTMQPATPPAAPARVQRGGYGS